VSRKSRLPKLDFGEIDEQATTILFDEQQQAVPSRRILLEIPVDSIDPNPHQVRRRFNQATLEQLADTMREDGFTSVLRVRRHPTNSERYQLVYGERRWRAAKLVAADPTPRFRAVPCELVEATDEQMAKIGLLENIQREDLLPEEEAEGMRELLAMTLPGGERAYSIRKLAGLLKKDESYIQDRLFLLELPEDVKRLYIQYPDIALRGLREVCNISTPEARGPVIERIIAEGMPYARIRTLVQAVLEALEKDMQKGQPLSMPVQANVQTREGLTPIEKQHLTPAFRDNKQASDLQEPTEQSPAVIVPQPVETPLRLKRAPRASYTGMLHRDEKLVFSMLDGWAKLLEEADNESKQQVLALVRTVMERCSLLQAQFPEQR
jgi:ParB/RepB/Spo0J family partition protein